MATAPTEQSALFRASALWGSLSREIQMLILLTMLGLGIAAGYVIASSASTDTTKVPLFNGTEFTLQERNAAIRAFATAGLSGAEIYGDQILVPKDQMQEFIRAIPEDSLPGNLEADLDEYVESDSWWKSRDESRRQYRMYTARSLARRIKLFPEIIDAMVSVTEPPAIGLRRTGHAKASVTVSTLAGQPLAPVRVREIQNLVAHSFTDLAPERVFVVANAPVDSSQEDGPVNTKLAEMDDKALQVKEAYRKTIEHHLRRALSHLPGATVVANVEVNPTQEIYQRIVTYDKGVPVSTDTMTLSEETPQAATVGGPPGVRTNVDAPPTVPNQGATAAAAAATKSDETSSTVFNNNMVETSQRGQDFQPKLVGVVVNVPRELLEATTVTGADGQDQVQPAVTTEQDIIDAVVSLNYPGLTPDMVKVVRTVIPEPLPPEEAAFAVFETVRRYGMDVMLALLGIGAVVGAIILARRAPMPEVVRMPQEQEEPDDAAEEEELAAMEHDEEAMKAEKRQDDITNIVTEKPEAAANLIRRWVQQEE